MEVVLNQGHLAHRNIYGGILWRISLRGPGITENGKVVQIAEVPANRRSPTWESTNPCRVRENKKCRRELKLTVVIHRLVGIELQVYEIHSPMKREQNGHTTTE